MILCIGKTPKSVTYPRCLWMRRVEHMLLPLYSPFYIVPKVICKLCDSVQDPHAVWYPRVLHTLECFSLYFKQKLLQLVWLCLCVCVCVLSVFASNSFLFVWVWYVNLENGIFCSCSPILPLSVSQKNHLLPFSQWKMFSFVFIARDDFYKMFIKSMKLTEKRNETLNTYSTIFWLCKKHHKIVDRWDWRYIFWEYIWINYEKKLAASIIICFITNDTSLRIW